MRCERDTTAVVEANGGKVLGSGQRAAQHADFSSFLLQAQASKAKIIGLANAGGDTINSIKQAAEFGIVAGGQKLAGLLVFISDVHSLGLQTAQGLVLTEAFYWDQNDADARLVQALHRADAQAQPTMVQAGVYGAIMHYLEGDRGRQHRRRPDRRSPRCSELPINDFMTKNGKIREDGRVMHDMYLFEVKKPAESKYPWDYYKLLATIPGDQAFSALSRKRMPAGQEG